MIAGRTCTEQFDKLTVTLVELLTVTLVEVFVLSLSKYAPTTRFNYVRTVLGMYNLAALQLILDILLHK
jgi:hypothetical protein